MAFYQGVIDRGKTIPGVVSAGYTTFLPLTSRGSTSSFEIEGGPPEDPSHPNDANRRAIRDDDL